MSYSSPFVYVRVLGTLGNNAAGTEQWNVGFKIPHSTTPITPADLTTFLAAISGPISTFFTTTQLGSGSSTYLKGLTAALIGTDGKYVGGGTQATTTYTYPSAVAGAGSPVNPYSTAIVVSLRTQNSRGLASNGRMYWPSMAAAVQPLTGLFLPASMQTVATAAKTMLDAINTAAAAGLASSQKVSVMSNVGSGTLAWVTSVRVGCKPDRQERRERSLPETYQLATLASTAAAVQDRSEIPIGDPIPA